MTHYVRSARKSRREGVETFYQYLCEGSSWFPQLFCASIFSHRERWVNHAEMDFYQLKTTRDTNSWAFFQTTAPCQKGNPVQISSPRLFALPLSLRQYRCYHWATNLNECRWSQERIFILAESASTSLEATWLLRGHTDVDWSLAPARADARSMPAATNNSYLQISPA